MFDDLPGQIHKAIIEADRWKLYLDGLGTTILIAVGAVLIGLLLGSLVGIAKVHKMCIRDRVYPGPHERYMGKMAGMNYLQYIHRNIHTVVAAVADRCV